MSGTARQLAGRELTGVLKLAAVRPKQEEHLVRSNHGVSLTTVLLDDDDCAVLDRKSRAEQFGHPLGDRRWEGDSRPGDGIADTNGGCGRANDGSWLNIVPNKLNLFA